MNKTIKNYESMVKLFGPVPSGRPHSTPHIDAIRRALIAEGKSAKSLKVKTKSSSKGKNKAPAQRVEDFECSDDDDFTPESLAKSKAMFAAWRASSKPVEEENDSDDDLRHGTKIMRLTFRGCLDELGWEGCIIVLDDVRIRLASWCVPVCNSTTTL
jgi:hypothetical protein